MAYTNQLTTQVTGTVKISNFGSTVPVSGTVATSVSPAYGAYPTSVSASAFSKVFVQKNASRKQLWVYNYGSTELFLNLGESANTSSAYFLIMEPGSYWELPVTSYIYAGPIAGLWKMHGLYQPSGSAQVMEVR